MTVTRKTKLKNGLNFPDWATSIGTWAGCEFWLSEKGYLCTDNVHGVNGAIIYFYEKDAASITDFHNITQK